MSKILFLLCFICISCISLFSQVEATTHDGKRVILNNDGTWGFVEQSTESASEGFVNCSQFIHTVQANDGGVTRATKTPLVIRDSEERGFQIVMMEENEGNVISFNAEVMGSGDCIDETGVMNVKFRIGNTVDMENNEESNFERKFKVFFGSIYSNAEVFELFTTLEIESIGIWTTEGHVSVTLSLQQSKSLLNSFHCLAN